MNCPVCGAPNAVCTPPGYVSPHTSEEPAGKSLTLTADKALPQTTDKSREIAQRK